MQKIGISLFIIALLIFTLMLGLDSYELTAESISVNTDYHKNEILKQAEAAGMLGNTYNSNISFISDFKSVLKNAQASLNTQPIPEGVSEWDFKLGNWNIKEYVFQTTKNAGMGWVSKNPVLFFLLTFGLGILGGILYIIPKFRTIPGIKNNHIYQRSMTRGLKVGLRGFILGATILGVIVYGFFYMNGDLLWPVITAVMALAIIGLVLFYQKQKKLNPDRSASPDLTGWLGVFTGIYFIGFYILLYWSPGHIAPWVTMVEPVSKILSGNPAGYWFLYGFLYTVVVLVMGVRMIAKYRHNKYQVIRTFSVMFFQTAIAFMLAEILIRLNQPYYDFKNIFPLDYDFFFPSEFKKLIDGGSFGYFMFIWGIILFLVGVPLFTYFFGKRWYCSWVCGCGGLAETLGDPYRQLSDKSLEAWQYERWIIHGVLAFSVVMTGLVLYTYFTGAYNVLFLNSDTVRTWYGFLIGSAFAGVVGTGFYPLMGNRVWCRFGCPLAAYLGLVQRFKSRFRITVNGGQCISCGNCSTYCEMGIDVRHYAQRGQDVVRSSCVGCGICAAVCPRGVLRLENASEDIAQRTEELKVIHIKEGEVGILN